MHSQAPRHPLFSHLPEAQLCAAAERAPPKRRHGYPQRGARERAARCRHCGNGGRARQRTRSEGELALVAAAVPGRGVSSISSWGGAPRLHLLIAAPPRPECACACGAGRARGRGLVYAFDGAHQRRRASVEQRGIVSRARGGPGPGRGRARAVSPATGRSHAPSPSAEAATLLQIHGRNEARPPWHGLSLAPWRSLPPFMLKRRSQLEEKRKSRLVLYAEQARDAPPPPSLARRPR